MKKYFTIAVLLMTMLVIGTGSAMAWSNKPIDRVTVAADDRGDLLFNQFYLALDGGWATDIWVANMRVNTLTQQGFSSVAKLTVHSGVYSRDIRDINIYLTPGDVCRLRLYYNAADGRVYLYSTDSSVRNNTNTAWASAADPLNVAMINTSCNDQEQYGYVTVMGIANSNAAFGTTNLAMMSPTGANSPERIRNSYLADAGVGATWWYGADPRWDGNWLTGYTEIRNTTVGLTSGATTMLAVADYRNLLFRFESQTVALGAGARNNVTEVEAILSTLRTDMPFVNNATDGVSLITHTFPTKDAWTWTNPTTCLPVAGAAASQFFNQNVRNGRVAHMRYAVDMAENLRMSGFSPNLVFPDEVNGVFTDAAHDPVLFSATMNMGYMITEFDQLQVFVTQDCRLGYATDTAAALRACPNRVAGTPWPFMFVANAAPWGAPVYQAAAAPVPAGYALATPALWDVASTNNAANYPPTAWPIWVARNNVVPNSAAQDMTQYMYGLAFRGAPVIPAELRFGGQSFSLNACARTPSPIATTTRNPGVDGGGGALVDIDPSK